MKSFGKLSRRVPSADDGDASEDALGGYEEETVDEDVFILPPNPSLDRLKKWRQATLALNATRRFRYTLDLRKQDTLNKGAATRRLRAGAHALRAVQRFREAGLRFRSDPLPEGFGVARGRLLNLIQDHQLEDLNKLGGVGGLAKSLHSHLEEGIDNMPEEVKRRQVAFGVNSYPRKHAKSLLVFVWEACQDTTLIILMVAAAVSLATGMWADGVKEGWYDGTSIAAAVLVVIAVTAGSDYKQSLQFRNLSESNENIQLEVVRGGQHLTVSIFDVVVGDIVPLSIGGQVPADGIFVSGHALSIDESSMTGESCPVKKDHKNPFLLSGCKVEDGYGILLVTGVGTNTEWGQIMATISEDNAEETPLQVRLNGTATLIGKVGLSVAVVVFFILFARYFALEYKMDKKASVVIKSVVNIFSIAVTIVVVAVPEGLPLAVTLTLAYSMRKMMVDKSLVRHLVACETMGSATAICSDKTGTLTTNKMSVTKAWMAGNMREANDTQMLPHNLHESLKQAICLNSTGSVAPSKEGKGAAITGSPTEAAVLSWGLLLGMDFKEIRRETPVLHVEIFNSTKKRAGVVYELTNGDVQAHWKGAAEIILDQSTHWIDSQGSVQILTSEKVSEMKNVIEGMAAGSLRCIAFAYRAIDRATVPLDEEMRAEWTIPETGLILMAIAGIKDPCRPGVLEAVRKCQAAGVKVRMVTGDNLFTAKAIAQECGILTTRGLAIEGKEFRTFTMEQMNEFLPKLDVMARSSPMDKLLLVKSLRERGEVVAVTGDGTNDAPALHEADIGLSMGIAGTEVAKESSDIIILDDDFTSVVKVVRWGRSVFANIQRFIQFQLTVNVVALVINFVAAISTGNVPLTAVQLLWVNLIMDTLGALALATEPPTDELMERKPVGRREPLITNIMWRNIFVQAVYQLAVLLTLDFAGKQVLKLKGDKVDEVKNTIIFNSFVFCQLFNEINSRQPEKLNVLKGIFKNHIFLGVWAVSLVFQIVIVEFLNKFASTVKLSFTQWVLCVIIGFISLPIGFFSKFIPVPERPIMLRKPKKSKHVRQSQMNRKTQSDGREEEDPDSSSLANKMLSEGEIEGLGPKINHSPSHENHLPDGTTIDGGVGFLPQSYSTSPRQEIATAV